MADKVSRDASFDWDFKLTIKTKCPACDRIIYLKPISLYLTHQDGACARCGAHFSWRIGASKSEWYVEKLNEMMKVVEKIFHRWNSTKSVYFSKIRNKG